MGQEQRSTSSAARDTPTKFGRTRWTIHGSGFEKLVMGRTRGWKALKKIGPHVSTVGACIVRVGMSGNGAERAEQIFGSEPAVNHLYRRRRLSLTTFSSIFTFLPV